MININEEDDNEEEDGNDNNDDNYDNDIGKDNDEEKDKMKCHESRGDKGNNNSRSMASLLAEICRGGEDNIPERSPADDPSSDKMATSAHASNRGNRWQMQLQASEATSEEDNDDIAPDAANDDDEADAASSDQPSVDNNIARTERLLTLYFSLLAKTGAICTVEEEFTLVTAKLNLVFKQQKFIVSDKDLSEQGNIAQSSSAKWKSLLNSRESGGKK